MTTPRQEAARRNPKARRVQGSRAHRARATETVDGTTAYPTDPQRIEEWDETLIKVLPPDSPDQRTVLEPKPVPLESARRLAAPPPSPIADHARHGGIAEETAVRRMAEEDSGFPLFKRFRPRRQPVSRAPAEPPSSVRVLHTDSEVHAAVERAVESDQFAQEALSRRIDRYKAHEPDPTGEVMSFPDRHGPAQPGSGQQHPA